MNCTERLEETHRSKIRHEFRSSDFQERRQWLNAHVMIQTVKKKKKTTKNPEFRNHTLIYTLPMPDGSAIRVCKAMFLSSLGARSDGIVMEFVRSKL